MNSNRRITSADLANPDHAAAVLHLLDAYARDPMGGDSALSDYARRYLIARLRERPGVHVLLAFFDDTPAGLAICIQTHTPLDDLLGQPVAESAFNGAAHEVIEL